MSNLQFFSPQVTGDGSFTFFSPEFEETFHSQGGAKQEAELKFIEPCLLRSKAQQQDRICILDVCYGLGYNSAAALAGIGEVNPHCRVELVALELNPTVAQAALAYGLLDLWGAQVVEGLAQLVGAGSWEGGNVGARMFWGDARQSIKRVLGEGFQADAIFLDPFSPPKCPQLWTVEFLGEVAQVLAPTGRLATYSCAAAVRGALREAGLRIGASPRVGRRSPGTVASWAGDLPPLSLQEEEHLRTRAAVPYRDRTGQDSPTIIRQRRQGEQASSPLEPSSHWKKRWA
ncbi:tRNA (5-methylaminomethyl-2-thiouridine)(34)-methyltransferase MnmD [Spirulina subsalsa]|uniref:tRNA (5-methylaminomethyl-2-thiouridine)(34)-methyltransferase MnmD n=1 Tax=Spirulina subsalsa TaxID=54311 RepID=UPI0002FB750B|nr:MnmC family methyltransferase [Spirulina subsalsa]